MGLTHLRTHDLLLVQRPNRKKKYLYLMKCKFISRECVQMEPSICLCHHENGKTALLRWSPMWCLPQLLQCQSQYKKAFKK